MIVILRIDYCDERPVYKINDISGTKSGIFIIHTSPKRSEFSLSDDVRYLSFSLKLKKI